MESDKLQVDLLITVDAAAAWETDEVDRTVSSNVKENISIYQSTESMVESFSEPNTAISPKKTSVKNSNYFPFQAIFGKKTKSYIMSWKPK